MVIMYVDLNFMVASTEGSVPLLAFKEALILDINVLEKVLGRRCGAKRNGFNFFDTAFRIISKSKEGCLSWP